MTDCQRVFCHPIALVSLVQKANIDEKAIRFSDPSELVVALAKAKVIRKDMRLAFACYLPST